MTDYEVHAELQGDIDRYEGSQAQKKRKLCIYEVGTGMLAYKMADICDISCFDYSKDGRYIVVGSDKGVVTIWEITGVIRENIQNVLEDMAKNPEFWSNYPIYCQSEEEPEQIRSEVGEQEPIRQVTDEQGINKFGPTYPRKDTVPLVDVPPQVEVDRFRQEQKFLPRQTVEPIAVAQQMNINTKRSSDLVDKNKSMPKIHPPQVHNEIRTQANMQPQYARNIQGPSSSEIPAITLDIKRKFQRDNTFCGKTKDLYKREDNKAQQTPTVRISEKISAPENKASDAISVVHNSQVMQPKSAPPQENQAENQMPYYEYPYKHTYRNQEEAIATLLDFPLEKTEEIEVKFPRSISSVNNRYPQEKQKEPEDIDKDNEEPHDIDKDEDPTSIDLEHDEVRSTSILLIFNFN